MMLEALPPKAGKESMEALRKEGIMIKVGVIHHALAYLAAFAAVVALVFAGVSRLLAQPVGFALFSWMTIAGVAMLFAIYFSIGGIFFRDAKISLPLLKRKAKREAPQSIFQSRVFSISGNNKGLNCPFKQVICQDGYCVECQVYLEWQESGEALTICALCGKELSRKPGSGQMVSRAMCPECWERFFAIGMSRQ